MQNYWEKYLEEYNKMNPGAMPEDATTRMPESIAQEFQSRVPSSDIHASDPSKYDVHVSDKTVTMDGRPESLPSHIPATSSPMAPKWELEEDAPQEAPQPIKSEPDVAKSEPVASSDKAVEDLFRPTTDNDKAAREAGLAEVEKRRKLGIIPQILAGTGDAISATASAFGGNAPGGSLQRLVERQDKDIEQGKKDVETNLRNDPNSDISRQYQDMVARFMQKDPKDPLLLGLTANQISEKMPQIEKLVSLRQQDELKRAQIEANKESRLSREAMAREKLDQKSQAAQEKKQASIEEAKSQAGLIRQTIKDIKDRKLIGYDTAGPAGSSWIAPLDYPDLAEKLNTIAGNIAFTTLNKMRQNSPTGGAVGQVSDRDMALLASVKGSLSQRQSPQQLEQTLKRLDEIYTKVEGYDADVDPLFNKPTAAPQSNRQTKSGFNYTVGQ